MHGEPVLCEISSFALLALVAAWIATLVAAMIGARRKESPGGEPLFWLMLVVALWSLGAAVELTVTDIPAKLFWVRVQYLGTLACCPLFLLFAVRFARARWLDSPGRVAALFAVPAATYLFALTNEWHGLVWPTIHLLPGAQNLAAFSRGPVFWLGVIAYSYLCLAAGTWQLGVAALRLPRALRRQAVVVLVGSAIPWLANISFVFGGFPVRGLDPTPLSMAVMGVVVAFAVVHFGLVGLVPAARSTAVQVMGSGLVVLDEQGRVIDRNPAARLLLGPSTATSSGQTSRGESGPWAALLGRAFDGPLGRFEVAVPGDPPRTLEADVVEYRTPRGPVSGRFVLLRDVSERRRAEGALAEANRLLQSRLAEIEALQESLREQALRDPLTGLFNRRYLEETLERELVRAERAGEPLAAVLLDLDGFKVLNDRLGHAAGDELLRELGLLLRAKTRRSDFACRYGGDEFLVVMPGSSPEEAAARADDLRRAFAGQYATSPRQGIACTLSAGVAVYPGHAADLRALLAAADLALYAAKAAGRDRVAIAT
ncbi:MAG: diguanylate cyclase [Thermoanaerobaculia bacterium]|nr:diguanylate cyclase [Thermoanaerobaculia bacterium]